MAEHALFQGNRNGSPRFDFGSGDEVPPKWLIERLDKRRIDGDALVLKDGTRLEPGTWLSRSNG